MVGPMSARKLAAKSGRKSAATPGGFKPGHDPRRGRGPAKGAPNAGRPPDEFKALMRSLASRQDVIEHLTTVLGDPNHPDWHAAWKDVADRGYGKAVQAVDLGTGVKRLLIDLEAAPTTDRSPT